MLLIKWATQLNRMTLEDLVSGISNFTRWTHAEKIRFFGWYLHSKKNKDWFQPADIRACYSSLGLAEPTNISQQLINFGQKKPKEVLHNSKGYALEKRVKDSLEAKYGQRASTVQVLQILSDLPQKIPSVNEKIFLQEALICFRHKAFRASMVMCWNLAYDHLCEYVMNKHIADFNLQLPKTYPKADISAIIKKDDFSELKESQVLQVCRSAGITTNDAHKILKEKLDRRNTAAHPSSVVIAPQTAEEYIIDLITNVVLKLV